MDSWFLSGFQLLYGEKARVYGPYTNDEGRKFVVIKLPGHCTSKLYSKVVLEIKLGRRLSSEETCDHVDEDRTNDAPDNLQLLSRPANAKKSALRRVQEEVSCVLCGCKFIPTSNQVNARALTRSGPFCSKVCAGKSGSALTRIGIGT